MFSNAKNDLFFPCAKAALLIEVPVSWKDQGMESDYTNSASDNDRDAQIVADCLAAGKPVPPDVAGRVRERADHARKQLLASHGIQNVGVEIIREIRGELPQP